MNLPKFHLKVKHYLSVFIILLRKLYPFEPNLKFLNQGRITVLVTFLYALNDSTDYSIFNIL